MPQVRAAYQRTKAARAAAVSASRQQPAKAPTLRRRGFQIKGTHSFHRYATTSTNYVVPNLTTELDVGMHFTLDEIVNVAEFTALFDRYKITGILLKFQLINNPDAEFVPSSTTTLAATNYYPKLWYCFDPDDANPLTLTQIKERENVKCRVLKPNSTINFFVKPAVLLQTYRTALTTGYAPKFDTYIDCGQADLPHYGVKFVIDTLAGVQNTNGFGVRLEKKFFFTMKDVR